MTKVIEQSNRPALTLAHGKAARTMVSKVGAVFSDVGTTGFEKEAVNAR